MLSYEIPLGLAILVVVLTTGQVQLEQIVQSQVGPGNCWNVLIHPVAFLVLLVAQFAETNRAPFDLAEAEQELVGGFHTEYSALKFGMFFLAEYAHMITNSAFISVLFLGGWHLPFVPGLQPGDTTIGAMIFKIVVLSAKIAALIFLYMWVRWTIPRFRFDQLMRLAWKGLVPIGLGLAAVATLMLYGRVPAGSLAGKVGWGLLGNLLVVVGAVVVLLFSPARISGRQANMPELAAVAPAAPGNRPTRP